MRLSLLGSKQLQYKYIQRVQYPQMLITPISMLVGMVGCSILGMTECHLIFSIQGLSPQIESSLIV